MRCVAALIGLVAVAVLPCGVWAQLVVNNGAVVTVRENAVVKVNGDILQQGASPALEVHDGATLQVDGNVTIYTGSVQLHAGALMEVTQDMTIASGAVLNRGAPGSLRVYGNLVNQGTVNNNGTVEVGPP